MGQVRFLLWMWFIFFNRAAMDRTRFWLCTEFIVFYPCGHIGWARFLLGTGFVFIDRADMGRTRLLLCTGLINRAAMGGAPFMFCTWLINHAAMGQGRFLLCPWFIFFICAAMDRARFLLYPRFIYYFFLLPARPWAEHGSCSTVWGPVLGHNKRKLVFLTLE